MATVYEINKGIGRPIEFKGIKAQYIGYLAAGMVLLLLLFAILYIVGAGLYISLGIVLPSGYALYAGIQHYSKKYGAYGLIKKSARTQLPTGIIAHSRKCFTSLSENNHEKKKKTGGRFTDRQN
jgi:Domain of unknown function (DUF4133)